MTPLERFLQAVHDIRSTGGGVDETSYYGALESLFNEVGKTLKPHVRCVLTLGGKAHPDAGFYTAEQYERKKGGELKAGAKPSRGAIEVKPPKKPVDEVAKSEQVKKYLAVYGQVLVTNLREWRLVRRDEAGNAVLLEGYTLAVSEALFWEAAAHPKRTNEKHGTQFIEYLKRVMLHAAPLSAPEDVAFFLASYARTALARIEGVTGELEALAAVRSALEEALGLKFEGKKGEHFFRSSLIQTLFYGAFSAWVLWARQRERGARDKFDWIQTARLLRVPVLGALFHQVSDPRRLSEIGLDELMEWAAGVLTRVDRANFFQRFQEEHAVQYFYEPFLEAFDPELRKQLGVWYTPPEIVKYMVARVDTVLREELGCRDGLADKQVYVLDPCCGTGSYLVEVLEKIHETLRMKGGNGLLAADLKEAAREHVFGFEILPAPFVVSHLQLGLLLQKRGAPLDERKNERVGVYLTNALTGWEPPKEPKKKLPFPEFEQEREAADKVKRETEIWVVLGNPPYNAFAGIAAGEEADLIEPYKTGLVKDWNIKKFNLEDPYIRFFRLAERCVAEKTGKGVVSFISNHSWVSDPSFVVLRQHLLGSFDRFWLENMHGNRKISEYAPDGKTSETVFAIPGFSLGIQQGVVVSLWAKGVKRRDRPRVLFRDDINAAKATERRADLLRSLNERDFDQHYEISAPAPDNRFSFRPGKVSSDYLEWAGLDEIPHFRPSLGVLENRGDALIGFDRKPLAIKLQTYYDRSIDFETLKAMQHELTHDFARFDAKEARLKVLAKEDFHPDAVRKILIRPMDQRWCYYSTIRPLWNEPRKDYAAQCWNGNTALVSRRKGVASPEGVPFFFTQALGFQHALHTDAYFVPLRLQSSPSHTQAAVQSAISGSKGLITANYSQKTRDYLISLGFSPPDKSEQTAVVVWMHCLSIGYSPQYLTENKDGIRQDWPRVPLPASKELLEASAKLGEQVAALLDTEAPVEGVTAGEIREELQWLGVIRRAGTEGAQQAAPLQEQDLAVKAGWGHAGKGGVTMPGKGKLVERGHAAAERKTIVSGAKRLGLSEAEALAHLGERTCDVYLNDVAYWSNVPQRVWDYTIGGYQVVKKWLSYREEKLLGRPLSKDEVRYVQEMVRRIAAICLLEPALDANYRAVKENTYPWPKR